MIGQDERPEGLPAVADVDGGGTAPAWASMEALLARETGALARLRSWPTPARAGLVLVVALPGLATSVLPALRDGGAAAELLSERALRAALLGGLALLALGAGTRGLQRPPLHRALGWGLLLGAALAPVALALLPAGAPTADPGVRVAMGCLAHGVAVALPVLAVAVAVDRSSARAAPAVRLLGGAAGLAGAIALELHCPVAARPHMLLGHAPLAALFVLAAATLAAARR